MDTKTICEKIWGIEEKYDLFNAKINGVYFWKLIRMSVFMQISQDLGLVGQWHTQKKASMVHKMIYQIISFFHTYLSGVLTRRSNKDILVFEHGRKLKISGIYSDLYTKDLVSFLKKTYSDFEIVDKPYLGKHYDKSSENRSYYENLTFKKLLMHLFIKIKISDEEKKVFEGVVSELNSTFNIKLNISSELESKLKRFIINKTLFLKMLKYRSVKQVYLVVSYAMEAVVAACQEAEVECIELQHGVIDKYHLGYSYPTNIKVPYFPDQLLLFGKYWKDSMNYPISEDKVKIIGYKHLAKMVDQNSHVRKKSSSVIFISGGDIGKELSEIAYKFAIAETQANIIYKLHPGEFGRWREEYPVLIEAEILKNFLIVENQPNLYECLAETEFCVGVGSTVMFEAFCFNCKVIVYNLPGVEYMDFLIKKSYVKKASTILELRDYFKKNTFNKVDSEYFFSK